uniref:Leucine rich repeat containing 74A n=1 Tax=Electrophorus electricus TaxID=8005 RepID=A0A4W4F5L2_ELEEL
MDRSHLSLDSLSLAEMVSPYETDLEDEEDGKNMSTAELYLQACTMVGVVPVRYFLRNLGSDTINLNHHGLGPLGGKAIAIALVTDVHTTTLELKDNFLLGEGARYIVEMLKANFTIQNLVLFVLIITTWTNNCWELRCSNMNSEHTILCSWLKLIIRKISKIPIVS